MLRECYVHLVIECIPGAHGTATGPLSLLEMRRQIPSIYREPVYLQAEVRYTVWRDFHKFLDFSMPSGVRELIIVGLCFSAVTSTSRHAPPEAWLAETGPGGLPDREGCGHPNLSPAVRLGEAPLYCWWGRRGTPLCGGLPRHPILSSDIARSKTIGITVNRRCLALSAGIGRCRLLSISLSAAQ
jgi:hypothetical protein